jgi:hypothetical protein
MFQTIDGHHVFVADITESPLNLLPIADGGNLLLRPYAQALESAILIGIVRTPGKYGIEVDALENHYNIYSIQE